MTLIINLANEHEAAIKAKALAHGVSAEQYAERALEMNLHAASISMSGEEKACEFEAWTNSFPETPPLSDEAISRESLNPDRC